MEMASLVHGIFAAVQKEIKPMEQIQRIILALKPVTFRYKELDAKRHSPFGLIAEEVAEVNPGFGGTRSRRRVNTVRYDR